MKTFRNFAAQGEAFIRRIEKAPEGCAPVAAENGLHILAHSETGHHHVMASEGVTVMERPNAPEGMRILIAIVENPDGAVLEHQRAHDTHEPIRFDPGTYEFRLQREYTPEGYRRVAD